MPAFHRIPASVGFVAALSLAASPLSAVELVSDPSRASVPVAAKWNADDQNVRQYRYGGYGGYGYRDRGIDAGDVIGGIIVIGTIAAIASAVSKNSRNRRDGDYRNSDYRYRDYRTGDYRDRPYDYRSQRTDSRYSGSGQGIDRAVDMCVARVERDVRVDRVDSVDRTAEGWRVTGSLHNGENFTCRIGRDGRVEDIDYGRGLSQNNQYDDDRYARARMEHEGNGQGSVPAYPADPVEDDYEYAQDDYSTGD